MTESCRSVHCCELCGRHLFDRKKNCDHETNKERQRFDRCESTLKLLSSFIAPTAADIQHKTIENAKRGKKTLNTGIRQSWPIFAEWWSKYIHNLDFTLKSEPHNVPEKIRGVGCQANLTRCLKWKITSGETVDWAPECK